MKITDLKTQFLCSHYSVLSLFAGSRVSSLRRLSTMPWCESLSSRLSRESSWLGLYIVLTCSCLSNCIYLITQLGKSLGKLHYNHLFPPWLTIEKKICCHTAKFIKYGPWRELSTHRGAGRQKPNIILLFWVRSGLHSPVTDVPALKHHLWMNL